jgi:hypothetical protein
MCQLSQVLIVTMFLCVVTVPSAFAQTPAGAVANDKMTFEEAGNADSEWPEVADNQRRTPRTRMVAVNSPPIDQKCPNPCVGGTGCTGWETVAEATCRSTGGTTYDCQSSGGFQYCARKSLDSGLITCQTCIN